MKARAAIWNLVRALRLGTDEAILLPSYTCGAEVDAVLKAGAHVRFYRIDRSARIDVDSLPAISPGDRGVLVTHFFGFADSELDSICDLCREHGLFLIEDCAHALYSHHRGRPLGTFGDAAVFSLWKTLPLPDGGAVRTNGSLQVAADDPAALARTDAAGGQTRPGITPGRPARACRECSHETDGRSRNEARRPALEAWTRATGTVRFRVSILT